MRTKLNTNKSVPAIVAGICSFGVTTGAAEETFEELDPVLVSGAIVGSKEGVKKITGSATYLDIDDLRVHSISDINSALRRVPGVYVRPEDGYGNFPNISLRGIDMGRSSKVTIMEDGILAAPAPYSAPSAYYSPTLERMSGLEVVKGSSQVKYGPHTTGGAINYLSTPIPEEITTYSKVYYGEYDEMVGHIYHGGKKDTDLGRVGYLVEGYYRNTEGFKELQGVNGETGFTRSEPMLKLSWEPNTSNYQSFELKLGSTDFDANETYLGITDEDFKANPYSRYAATRNDMINTYASRGYLRHFVELGSNASLKTTAYFTKFHRNWFKLDKVGTLADGKAGKSAYKVWNNNDYLSVIKGESAGFIRLKANNRDYSAQGIESILNYDLELGSLENEIQLGVRFHNDDIDRYQWYHKYDQGELGGWSSPGPDAPSGAAGDRHQETDAWSLYLEDRVAINDKLSVIPGIRYEFLDFSYDQNTRTSDKSPAKGSGDIDVVTGGLGLSCDVYEGLNLFGGVYHGASLPGPRSYIRSGESLDEESSNSYELGFRYQDEAFVATGALFYSDLEDFIVPDNLGTGFEEFEVGETVVVDNGPNDGEITAVGLELQAGYDFGAANGANYSLPVTVGITWTEAEFDSGASSADGESIFSGAKDGNTVPYIPEFQLHVGIGLGIGKFRLALDGTYIDESYASGFNEGGPFNYAGKYDSRYGEVPSYFVSDFSLHYSVTDNTNLFATAHNVFDEEYVVGRLPQGARPGMPQQLLFGIESQF
ncbi:MAG: TonB-dependent receptor [Verrucomicrobiota bacterium]|jgi:Fe(3+) dicitrate transport protein|nr:TonB-dependent receptor [Verrucomicrobiota bacterium]